MKKIILQMLLVIASVGFAQAQTRITGKVLDAEGKPLDVVSISVKEVPTAGTLTDADGNFTLNVPSGGLTLVFSYIGYVTQEVTIGSRSIIDITLESDATTLESSIVTALGIKRSEKSTSYAVTQIGNEELTKGASLSAMNALQGKIAGVNISSSSGAPGASTRVVLRGYSSITGSNDPLYVVDGIPVSNGSNGTVSLDAGTDYGNRFNDINPNDIESISVLKGAAASALYGSRAANGVILVTTKGGTAKESFSVDFVSNMTLSRAGKLPEMQNEFGQGWNGEYTYIENGSWGPKFDGKQRTWGNIVDGQQQYKPFSALETNVRDFFDTGYTLNNAISLNGGTANTTYYASYSNAYDDGIMPGNKDTYQRNSFTLKGSTKGKYFHTAASISYSNKSVSTFATGQQEGSIYNDIMQIPRDISIVDLKDYNYKFNNIDNYFTPYGVINPYYVIDNFGNNLVEDHLYGNVQIGMDVFSWLNITARVGEDYSSYYRKEWEPIFHASAGSPNEGSTNNNGLVYEAQGRRSELNGDLLISFKPKLNDNFSLNGILGYNIMMQAGKAQAQQVEGLDLDNWYHILNSSSQPSVGNTYSSKRIMGVFGQVDLAYKNFLYLTTSARNDWTSTLPKDDKSFFYPAVGISFIFTDAFPSIKKFISYGKIRASYGVTGNDPEIYSLSTNYTGGAITYPFGSITFPFDGIRGYSLSTTMGDPSLKPELTHEIEIGGDIRLFDNKLGFDISWYKRNTKNQIVQVDADPTTGFYYMNTNLGNVQNKGWEVMITANPIRTSDLNWSMSYTFTRNRNLVIELSENLKEVGFYNITNGISFRAKEGMAMGYYVGNVAEKSPDGRIVVNDKGIPVIAAEQDIIGESQGDYQMGFSSNLSYKGIYFSFSLDIRKGGQIFSRTASINYFVGHAPHTTYNDRNPFIVPNSVKKYANADGSYTYETNNTPISVSDIGTFWDQGGFEMDKSMLLSKTMIALREVVIGYNLPAKWFNNKFVKGIDISLIGSNLLLWTPDTNTFIDPQVSTFGTNILSEYGEFSTSPSTRKFGFSIKLKM
ncbi:MAG: SusC/RagA family TonB-linked outer membrane protein [Bacteroidales bacterium]|jgi:TonB-linked SusC/RagA family outer membrane protein|nr:SusC/RagA family TonB-linked outer membrane protein [Bacteroidales bacterium]